MATSGSSAEPVLTDHISRAFCVHDEVTYLVPDNADSLAEVTAHVRALMAAHNHGADIKVDALGNAEFIRGWGSPMRVMGEIFADEIWANLQRPSRGARAFPTYEELEAQQRELLDQWLESRDAHNADRPQGAWF